MTQEEMDAKVQAEAAHFAELATGFAASMLAFNQQMLALQQTATSVPISQPVQVAIAETNLNMLKTLSSLYTRGAARPPRGSR